MTTSFRYPQCSSEQLEATPPQQVGVCVESSTLESQRNLTYLFFVIILSGGGLMGFLKLQLDIGFKISYSAMILSLT